MHLEFIVFGVPISNQVKGPNLDQWRANVEAEAKKHWNQAALGGTLKVIVINFHPSGEPSLDVDNMSKPIFDVMQKIVYKDDRQIRQAEITHVRIDSAFVFVGTSTILLSAVQAGKQFVYVRIEEPVDPFPLPK